MGCDMDEGTGGDRETFLKRFCRGVGQYAQKPDGVSAVEFALILPLLVLMYVGTVEITNAISVNRKVVSTASAVGDLTAQASNIDDTSMSGIFDASTAVMQPYSTTPLKLRVTQLTIDTNGIAKVGWSSARNMTALTKGATFSSLPAGLATPNSYIIFSEANFSYTSPIGEFIQGTLPFNESFYLRPRVGNCVQRNGACS